MQPTTPRDALAIAAAAATGAVVAATGVLAVARRRARRDPGPHFRPLAAGPDRVDELHFAFRDRTVPPVGTPEEVLRQYWSRLHPLRFASASNLSVAPVA
jgi:hypothetical protein